MINQLQVINGLNYNFNDKISIGESECVITVKPRITTDNK